jgi:hypothetical protein
MNEGPFDALGPLLTPGMIDRESLERLRAVDRLAIQALLNKYLPQREVEVVIRRIEMLIRTLEIKG